MDTSYYIRVKKERLKEKCYEKDRIPRQGKRNKGHKEHTGVRAITDNFHLRTDKQLLVDDFDYEETTSFLEKYGFSDEEKEEVWEYCGGKPIYLVKVINAKMSGKDVKEGVEDLLETRRSQILSIKMIGGRL